MAVTLLLFLLAVGLVDYAVLVTVTVFAYDDVGELVVLIEVEAGAVVVVTVVVVVEGVVVEFTVLGVGVEEVITVVAIFEFVLEATGVDLVAS